MSVSNVSTAVQRSTRRVNMSWRKPVPQFVPSRPSSFISVSSGFTPFAAVGTKAKHPPLPKDWRSAIEKALTVDPPDVPTHDVERGTVDSHETAVEPVKDEDEKNCGVELSFPRPARTRSPHNGAESILSRDSDSTAYSKLTHQIYRPPTPPTSSHSKMPRTDLFNERDRTSFNNIVFPDLPHSNAPTPSLLNANIFPVTFDPCATTTATMTALGSRDDFHSQYNHDMTGIPKIILPSREVLASRSRQPNLWGQAWMQVKSWGGALKLSLVRLFGLTTRTPGAVTY